jgi:hypothetical protein
MIEIKIKYNDCGIRLRYKKIIYIVSTDYIQEYTKFIIPINDNIYNIYMEKVYKYGRLMSLRFIYKPWFYNIGPFINYTTQSIQYYSIFGYYITYQDFINEWENNIDNELYPVFMECINHYVHYVKK